MPQNKHFAVPTLLLLASFLFCGWTFAQNHRSAYQRPAQATPTPVIQARSAAIRPAKPLPPPVKVAKPSPAIPAAAPSLLSAPPEPAKVSLASGKLSVKANNSSLSQILRQIAKAGGMRIDGLQTGGNADPRVFGSYGPGAPRDVLSDLLNGTSYNVLMMGNTAAGIPREMALSLRGAAGVPNPAPRPSATAQDSESEDDAQPAADTTDTGDTDDVQSNGSAAEPESDLVPPAGVHENEPIPPPPGAQQKVKTPEEILQELQNMRMQQQQQQQQ